MAPDFSTAATTSHTDITSRFELDTGQRDNFYDIGRIKLKTGELTPTGRLLVNFDFFSHGSGDYFDVDSYSGVVDYADIPEYKSDTTGQSFQLRDCLDFRPRVDDASTINSGGQDRSFDGPGASTVDVVKFGDDITTDFEFYLSRIDKVFLDKDGSFKVVEGASSLDPQLPKALDGAMHLYTLSLAPYTLSTEEIEIETVDNRRYTMRDIGRLEKRIENIEYYTQLSLLETQTQSLQIQDADGFDRFKNGFIVDNFTGHGIGDVGNLDYRIAMDMASGEARPICKTDSVQLIEADDDGTTILSADRPTNVYKRTDGTYLLRTTTDVYSSTSLSGPYNSLGFTQSAPNAAANLLGETQNGDILVASESNGLYRYSNGVWTATGLSGAGTGGNNFLRLTSGRIVVGKKGGSRKMYYSDDDGLNWSAASGDIAEDWYNIIQTNNKLFVSSAGNKNKGGIITSLDDGSSWTNLRDQKTYSMEMYNSDIYIVSEDGARGSGVYKIFKSSDDGQSWTFISECPISGGIGVLIIHDDTIIFKSNSGGDYYCKSLNDLTSDWNLFGTNEDLGTHLIENKIIDDTPLIFTTTQIMSF